MSFEPMEFEKANDEHLGTWRRVRRATTCASVFMILVLALLAFFLL